MRVIYDAQIFLNQKTGGISRYHYELFKGGRKLGYDAKIAGRFVKNQYLLSEKQYKVFVSDPVAMFSFFNKLLIRHAVERIKPDEIFHPADVNEYLNDKIAKVKNLVFTIHDMIVENQDIHSGVNKLHYAGRASKIIAVSETTKNDIVRLFGIDRNKIEVIYHGSSLNLQMAVKPRRRIPDNFLLYVGNRDGYKNFKMLAKAIVPLLKKDDSLYFVCAGRRPFTNEELQFFKESGIETKTVCITGATDNELASLYGKAKAFLFPSLYEGFGIPILEAWSCETPVILSCNDCFTEIAAEAGEFFDPLSEDSIRDAVEKILTDRQLQKELIRKGAGRLQLFSWEKTVNQTYQLYKALL